MKEKKERKAKDPNRNSEMTSNNTHTALNSMSEFVNTMSNYWSSSSLFKMIKAECFREKQSDISMECLSANAPSKKGIETTLLVVVLDTLYLLLFFKEELFWFFV